MRTRCLTLVAGVIVVMLVGTGCTPDLNSVMRKFGYTALNPPDTAWEAGTPVRISGTTANPDPLLLPSMVQPTPVTVQTTIGAAPQVSQSHDSKFSLGAGVTVPQWLATKIEASYSNVRQYSVVSSGNKIVTVPLLPYVPAFNAMSAYAETLQPNAHPFRKFADDGTGYWLRRLWFADKLEYKFYDENGATVKLDVSKLNLAANADWKSTNEGGLSYDAAGAGGKPICIGYMAEPFKPVPNMPGSVNPFNTGPIAAGTVLPLSLDGLVPLSGRVLVKKAGQ